MARKKISQINPFIIGDRRFGKMCEWFETSSLIVARNSKYWQETHYDFESLNIFSIPKQTSFLIKNDKTHGGMYI